MNIKSIFTIFCILSISSYVYGEDYNCEINANQIIVRSKEKEIFKTEVQNVFDCIIEGETLFVARGIEGIEVYRINKEKGLEKITSIKTQNEVIKFKYENGKIYAISAIFSQLHLIKNPDGSYTLSSLSSELLQGKVASVGKEEVLESEKKEQVPPQKVEGKIIEVSSGFAIINLGSKDGIEKGMKFEILSSEMKKTYNIKTRTYEMMPSLESTAVSPVVQVSDDRCMIRIGRGNRAYVGDIALLTNKPLSESLYTPSYEKNLHRIYGRIAPFIGIETLTIGTLFSLMYDYTFNFPLKVEAGVRNAGILFSTKNTSPFQVDILPSYNTDFFEVGLGTGYSYSGHELQRNFLFLQKVRLGAIDGTSFTMWNSFIYQEKHSNWSFVGSDVSSGGVNKEGDPCSSSNPVEYEFAWNGFDLEIATPVSKSVNLFTHWAYSQAGWLTGEVSIRNFVSGNGGDGTLIIPVSIGGTGVFDYKKKTTHTLLCNPNTNKLEYEKEWDVEGYGGPIVSIGLDYRWR